MYYRLLAILIFWGLGSTVCKSQVSNVKPQINHTFTFVELNCENLFDCRHDEGKQDQEFTAEGRRHWTRTKYWRKLKHIAQEILSCADRLPELVALVEVENDSVMRDLTHRSLLRRAGYQYLMTESPDVRGLDVALLYQPLCFLPLCYEHLAIATMKNQRPTRDILYVKGVVMTGDTLHLYIVHAPSRYDGELETRPYRLQVARTLIDHLSTIGQGRAIVAGDFNDYADDASLLLLERAGLQNVSRSAKGLKGHARGTYRFRGDWHSLDHIFVSPLLVPCVTRSYINDAPFLLEEEQVYGGYKPFRTFNGFRYQGGFSDHLPLVVEFGL
ncbi:MAG: endonuclease/exonuclease/phosphatase family protein [Prevotella sp.]|nr:endonuclease/exonuclease/phosphatase family protein [Prevotella sp.]